jgi:hypothetical protein
MYFNVHHGCRRDLLKPATAPPLPWRAHPTPGMREVGRGPPRPQPPAARPMYDSARHTVHWRLALEAGPAARAPCETRVQAAIRREEDCCRRLLGSETQRAYSRLRSLDGAHLQVAQGHPWALVLRVRFSGSTRVACGELALRDRSAPVAEPRHPTRREERQGNNTAGQWLRCAH